MSHTKQALYEAATIVAEYHQDLGRSTQAEVDAANDRAHEFLANFFTPDFKDNYGDEISSVCLTLAEALAMRVPDEFDIVLDALKSHDKAIGRARAVTGDEVPAETPARGWITEPHLDYMQLRAYIEKSIRRSQATDELEISAGDMEYIVKHFKMLNSVQRQTMRVEAADEFVELLRDKNLNAALAWHAVATAMLHADK